ncbi:MAG: rhodanese-like domain-containing protein [Desulfobacterales bacterium]
MNASIKRALACCLLVIALPAGVEGASAIPAPEDVAGRKNQAVIASSRTGAPTAARLVDVRSVLQRLAKGDPLVLVDVRSPEAFERVRIPGSLNIPLQFIRTKPFLKPTSVVLVNEGFDLQPLARECERLESAGFAASVVSGGLCAWHRANGSLEGDLGAAAEFNRVTPQAVFLEKDMASRLVVDVSGVQSQMSREKFPHAVHVPLEEDPAAVLDRLQAVLDLKPEWGLLGPLVIGESGHEYDRMEQALRQGGFKHVFFLTGGIAAYRRYLTDLARLWSPRESRVKTITPCPTCGDGDGRGAED